MTQRTIRLQTTRGFHLITKEILSQLPELATVKVGLLNLFLQHTSAGLSINENYDKDVRKDMEMVLNRLVPQTLPYLHSMEGPDDMPAHVKSSLMGVSLTIPITQGQLAMGTWQGIWLGEFRDEPSQREILATLVTI